MPATVIIWWYGYPNLETLQEEVERNSWSQAFYMAYGEHGIRYIGSSENAREHPLPAELEKEGNQTFYLGEMAAPEIAGRSKAWQNLATQSLAYARPARAPQLFAGLHEATSLPWPPWRFKIRSDTACGAIFPNCATCSTQPRRKVSEASGRWPIASVKRSTCAMGADGASARAAARRWPTSRPWAKSRCLRHGAPQARCAGPGCSPNRWRRHTMCLARSACCATLRWCGSRPTRSDWCGTP